MSTYKYIGEKPAYFNGDLLEPGDTIEGTWDHPLLEEVKEDTPTPRAKRS